MDSWSDPGSSSVALETGSSCKPDMAIDTKRHRYPFCIVWTPIPVLTWLIPIIGHMGICTSSGIIRDFAGPYFVSEDDMAFGKPAKYWQLNPGLSEVDRREWDNAVGQASETYKHRMHNLCCDNCHSHAAMALNLQLYGGSTNWNMFKLCFGMAFFGRYTHWTSVLKIWLPFAILVGIILAVVLAAH